MIDPAYGAVAKVLEASSFPVLDVGCGLGLLAFWLREQGFQPPILGCDVDASKIAVAQEIARQHYPTIQFRVQDITQGLPEHQGTVCLLDVLQYLPPEQQKRLLKEAAARLPIGARLLIRTGLKADHWRYRWGRATDQFARKIGWMFSPPIEYPAGDELQALLEEAGLEGDFRPLWGKTPFHNYFGNFTRRQSA